jgi:3-dehydroquinate dehydratase-2
MSAAFWRQFLLLDMHIIIINGPNLNLLGTREPHIYGNLTFEDYLQTLRGKHAEVEISYFQSNHEGAIIDCLHKHGFTVDGIILNAGAYSHTSIAIADAIGAISAPVIEVHISNVHAREAYRHHSFLSAKTRGQIVGLGLKGYDLAIEALRSSAQGD